jgi:hypothetical protein
MAASASSDRIGQIEQRLEQLEAKVDALGPDQSAEIRTSKDETHRLITEGDEATMRLLREGDEETRRHMRLLHEEVIGRIAVPGESLSSERSPRPCRRPKAVTLETARLMSPVVRRCPACARHVGR